MCNLYSITTNQEASPPRQRPINDNPLAGRRFSVMGGIRDRVDHGRGVDQLRTAATRSLGMRSRNCRFLDLKRLAERLKNANRRLFYRRALKTRTYKIGVMVSGSAG